MFRVKRVIAKIKVGVCQFSVHIPCGVFCTFTSRKLTEFSLMSAVNFIVPWNEFKAIRKEFNSSCECCHIMKISSIYVHHTRGNNLLVDKKSLSSLSINKMA